MTRLIPDIGDPIRLPVVTSCEREASSLVTEYPVESRATKTDFVVPLAGALVLSGVLGKADLDDAIVDRLEALRARILIAETDLGVMAPCVLKDLKVTKAPEDGGGAKFTVTVKQIFVAEAREIQRPAGARKTSPPKDKGRQPAKAPGAEEEEGYNSILSRITDSGVSF